MNFTARLTRSPLAYDPDLGAGAAARFGDHPTELRGLIAGTAGCSPYLPGLAAMSCCGTFERRCMEPGVLSVSAGYYDCATFFRNSHSL